MRYVLLGTVMLLPYYALLCLIPGWCLRLMYGESSTYLEYASLLVVFVMLYYVKFLETALGPALSGLGKSRANFAAQVVQMVVVLAVAWPLTIYDGVRGVALGSVLAIGVSDLVTIGFLCPHVLSMGKTFRGVRPVELFLARITRGPMANPAKTS